MSRNNTSAPCRHPSQGLPSRLRGSFSQMSPRHLVFDLASVTHYFDFQTLLIVTCQCFTIKSVLSLSNIYICFLLLLFAVAKRSKQTCSRNDTGALCTRHKAYPSAYAAPSLRCLTDIWSSTSLQSPTISISKRFLFWRDKLLS